MILPKDIDENTTLFLDRDGVINVRPIDSYVFTPNKFVFIDGAKEAIAKLSKVFARIIVVTNQQGIGKNLMTLEAVNKVHHKLISEVEKIGGKIEMIYVAPELKSDDSLMRKPNIGMGIQAQKDFPNIDFENSVMVGDTESDMMFGKRLKMTTVIVGPEGPEIFNQNHADYFFESLSAFSKIF
jgi:histidinol-phosphate phosphatase family protein